MDPQGYQFVLTKSLNFTTIRAYIDMDMCGIKTGEMLQFNQWYKRIYAIEIPRTYL